MTDDTDSTEPQGGLPVVRLRPKANARAIRHGFPWVYADELVIDRRTKALAAGSLAVLQDAERGDLGVVTVNPASKIVARMLDADAGALLTEPFRQGDAVQAGHLDVQEQDLDFRGLR